MRALLCSKKILILILGFLVLRIFQFVNLTELSLPHDAHHYLLLGKNLAEGKGYIANSVWAISFRPQTIPFPNFDRAPGLPLLYSLVFKIFGFNFLPIKILTIVLIVIVLIFTFLLGLKILKNKNFALVSFCLILLAPSFYNWTDDFLAELPYGVFSLICFYFLFSSKIKDLIWAGIFWGLTYFCRYQAMVLLGGVIFFYLIFKYGFLKGIKYFLIPIFCFFLIVSPWLWRNYKLTGNPFYTDLRYHLAAVYQDNFSQYFFGLDHPPEPINVFLNRPFYVLSYFLKSAYRLLIQMPKELMGNLVIFFLVIFGLVSLFKKEKIIGFTIFLYFLFNFFFFSFSLPETRYLYPLIPLVFILAGEGIKFVWQQAKEKKESRRTFFSWLYIFLFLGVVYYFNFLLLKGYKLTSKRAIVLEVVLLLLILVWWRQKNLLTKITHKGLVVFLSVIIGSNFLLFFAKNFSYFPHPTAFEAYQSAKLIKKLNLPKDTVFMTGGMPYYFEYYLDRPVIQFPYYHFQKKEDFKKIIEQYQVKYLIITKTQREFYPWLSSLIPVDYDKIFLAEGLELYVKK